MDRARLRFTVTGTIGSRFAIPSGGRTDQVDVITDDHGKATADVDTPS
ncbi:hypothetical protein ABZ471_38985 [Streptomyces sp. NPDC005728]